MTDMIRILSRTAALALLGLVAIGLPLAAIVPAWHFYQQGRESITENEDNIARFSRIVASIEALGARVDALTKQRAASSNLLRERSSPLAAAALQTHLEEVVESAGGKLTSTRVLPDEALGTFTKVTISAQMSVSTVALRDVLYKL